MQSKKELISLQKKKERTDLVLNYNWERVLWKDNYFLFLHKQLFPVNAEI
jgi:uncharacterized protein involved in tellurium resistance